ncbi:Atg27p [Lachancea thermotolerans CBS 6340]|uniref:Autophagy-related protein 27 n=1 Tax=Lachancea thermotolerans (strain ATCC 56472 / CBS 6340 / NRRL Y-8284) TaxID=559295 RepID=C5DKF6_LACTC|nr:KLTH0F04290p [Lachancea thermotolerans CBS 6340]CAR23957.1 KLTH0F04290p [Lachancea thermotolerans CBS 6340]
MKLSRQAFAAALFAQLALGFKCSQHDILKKYNVDKNDITHTSSRETPPSTTEEQWWINICQENTSPAPENCQKNDLLCGKTVVTLPDDRNNKLLTQLIDFTESVSQSASVNDKNELVVDLKNAKWGPNSIDAELTFVCTSPNDASSVSSVTWQDQRVLIAIKGSAGCLKGEKDGGNGDDNGHDGGDNGNDDDGNRKDGDGGDRKPHKRGSSLGSWFVWLVTYALLFALIYLLATSYMSTRGGNFREFREEFVERSTGLAASLPQFAKEVVSRVIGRGSSSQRGGYSAV